MKISIKPSKFLEKSNYYTNAEIVIDGVKFRANLPEWKEGAEQMNITVSNLIEKFKEKGIDFEVI